MPSPSYSLVKDDQDNRVPAHTDEEFFNGICFQAKVSSKKFFQMLKQAKNKIPTTCFSLKAFNGHLTYFKISNVDS